MLRVGLIGAGRWGKVYLKTLKGLSGRMRLAGLATRRPENRALVSRAISVFSDWKKLVAWSGCDAVIIATPAPLHAEMVRACLKAGKPCIVEKPLCLAPAVAQELQRASEKAGVPVLVNYVQLFNPAYRALKRALRARGEPVRVILSEGADLGPFRPETGLLWDRCPHDLSLCLDLAGDAEEGRFPPLREMEAVGGCPDPKGRPESVAVRLSWRRGPAAWIQAGRLSAEKRRTLSVVTDSSLFFFDDVNRERCRRIPFDYAGRMRLGSAPSPKEGRPLPVPAGPSPMAAMLAAFAEGVRRGRFPIGLGLTVEITRILERIEKTVKLF